MSSTFRMLAAISMGLALAGCHHVRTMKIERGPIASRQVVSPGESTCLGLPCDQTVYVDNCGFEDSSGKAIQLVLNRGQRICFKNVSTCEITIKYSTALFARSEPYVTISPEECTNLTVTSDATDADCTVELVCECGSMGAGHSNPDVIIGDD